MTSEHDEIDRDGVLAAAAAAIALGVDPVAVILEANEFARSRRASGTGYCPSPEELLRESRLAENVWREANEEAGARSWEDQASPIPRLIEQNNSLITTTDQVDIMESPSVRRLIRNMRMSRTAGGDDSLSKYLNRVADELKVTKSRGGQHRARWRKFVDAGLRDEYLLRRTWLEDGDRVVPADLGSVRSVIGALSEANYPAPPDNVIREDLARHLVAMRKSRGRAGMTVSDQAALWLLENVRRTGANRKTVTSLDLDEAAKLRDRVMKAAARSKKPRAGGP